MSINQPTGRFEPIRLEPRDTAGFILSWNPFPASGLVTIHRGATPETIDWDHPLAGPAEPGRVELPPPEDGRRVYYGLRSENGSKTVVAERQVRLKGSYNFRDMGGYPAGDGRTTRWGQVFRSDGLGRLTDEDLARLDDLGLKLVIDLRSTDEAEAVPDRLPSSGRVRRVHLPIQTGELNFVAAMDRLGRGDSDWLTPDYLVRGYLRNIDEYGPVWAEALRLIGRPENRPVVFHCTGGKDRAGALAALLLLALGVDRSVVIADHQLSNGFLAPLLPRFYSMVAAKGVDAARVQPYFTAPIEGITALLDHLHNQYGSIEAYIGAAGLGPEGLTGLRRELLV